MKKRPKKEMILVVLAMLFSLVTLYLMVRNGGCAMCLYKAYNDLIRSFISF